jgi:hypothetical protein
MEKIKHQIFSYNFPCEYFIDLLDDICDYDETKHTYIFHNISFKRAKFNKTLEKHLTILNRYYHDSKKHYIQNGYTFKGLHTIIRQLCKFYGIKYDKETKYSFSSYEIVYTIYIDS